MLNEIMAFVKENKKEILAAAAVGGLAYYYREEITPAVIGVAAGVYFHEEIMNGTTRVIEYFKTEEVSA